MSASGGDSVKLNRVSKGHFCVLVYWGCFTAVDGLVGGGEISVFLSWLDVNLMEVQPWSLVQSVLKANDAKAIGPEVMLYANLPEPEST